MKSLIQHSGFTLIEIVITIGIIAIFSGLIIPRYTVFNQETKLRAETKKLAEAMELAKKKATSSDLYDITCTDFNGYRVTVSNNGYSLNFGCNGTYQLVNQYNLDNNISITQGLGDFDFPPAGIGVNITINSIRLKNSGLNKCTDITISGLGIITVSDTLIAC